MAKLYEIVGAFKELLEMASEENMDQKLISDTLEGVEFEFEEKADGYAKVVKMLEGDVEAIDKEIKRLTEKKNTIKNNISGIKKNLENAMLITGKTKFKTLLFGYNIQKNPASVSIDDETLIPKDFWIEQEPKLDKKSLAAYLKENEVSWAHLTQTESLRIR
nr:MAG TPA: resistance protein [Caudoviricetes sp.]